MLEANAKRLDARQVRVHRGDALQWARQGQAERFDLVFIDPPFANDWFDGPQAHPAWSSPRAGLGLPRGRPAL